MSSDPVARPRLARSVYPVWLASDTATECASSLAHFAVPLLALMVTGSPAQAGVIGAAGLIVRLLATLLGGVLADRHDRIRLMIMGGLAGLVTAAGFTLLATAHALTFGVLLAADCLFAIRAGAFGVATQAALKDVVPAAALGRAQAANQGRDAVLALGAAPLGGVLLGVGGWLVGVVMTILQAVAAGTAWALRRAAGTAHTTVPTTGLARRSAAREFGEAVRWLLRRPDLRGALLVTTLVNLGFNTVVTTVIYALQQDGTTPTAIGFVSGGLGAGMLVGALAAPWLVSHVRTGVLAPIGLALPVVGCAILPFVQSVPGVAATLALCMIGVPALSAGFLGYFMVATPSHMMGRANSVLDLFASGAMPLSPLIAGIGLSTVGRTATLLIGLALCAISALLAMCTASLRGLPAEAGWSAHGAAAAAESDRLSSVVTAQQ